MLVTSTQKFIRTSPRKLRLVAQGFRGQNAKSALTKLGFVNKAASSVVAKVIKTAIGNAKNNFKLDENALIISRIMVNPGATLKRGRPVSRGQYHQVKKRTSHITITLESVEPKLTAPAKTKKTQSAETSTEEANQEQIKNLDTETNI